MKSTRTTQVHQLMEKHNLGVLIFWRPEELVMLLGYYPLWGLSFLVYTPHQIILLVPEGEPDDLLPQGIVIQKFPWGRLSEHDPWECLYAQVNEIVKAQQGQALRFSFIAQLSGSSPCRMSAEAPHLPSSLVARLLQTDAVYTPLDSELLSLFVYKNHVDIEGIQQAHRVISTAVQLFYQHAVPGMTEAKLASMIEYEVAIQMEQAQITLAKAWPLIQSGINSMDAGRFNRTTHRTIKEGDFVLLEMAACVNGYWLDITRTVVAGKSRPEQDHWIQIVRSAQCAAIAAIQPGVALSAIDAIARQYIETSGFGSLFNHALGHHVGFRYHDPGEGLHPFSKGVVTEGMVLTVEPGIYGAELKGGIRIEDNVLVTASGTRLLSDY